MFEILEYHIPLGFLPTQHDTYIFHNTQVHVHTNHTCSEGKVGKWVCLSVNQFPDNQDWAITHTVITPVAALTPASPKIAVAASVTNAVAPIFTTLSTSAESKMRKKEADKTG